MSFFSFGSKEGSAVVLDIESGSVGGALVQLSPGKAPRIIYSTRTPVAYQRELSAERLLAAVKAATEIVAGRVAHTAAADAKKIGPIRSVVCVLSAPWYHAMTKTIVFEDTKPFRVSPELILNLIGKDASLHAARRGEGDATHIEERTIQIRLNGYETADPYGKEARKLEATVFLGFASEKVLASLTDSLWHFFHTQKILFHSFPLASFLSLRDLFPDEEHFLAVHVSGEVTEISIIREGHLQESLSFPIGRNSTIRMIEKATGGNEAESLTLMQFALEKKKHPMPGKAVRALAAAKEAWDSAFAGILEPSRSSFFLSQQVFLVAPPEVREWFAESLRSYQEEQKEKPFFHITALGTDVLPRLAPEEHSADVPLHLEALSLGRLFEEGKNNAAVIHKKTMASAGILSTMRGVDPDKKPPMQDVFPPSASSPERSIRNLTIERDSRRSHEPAQAAPRARFNGMPPVREDREGGGGNFGRFALWGIATLAVAGLLFLIFSVFWGGAKVLVTPKSVTAIVDGTFTAEKTADAGSLPFEVMTVTRETTRTVPAQGTEDVQVSASGRITVFNDYSTGGQKLIANTRFETPGGLIYRIKDPITVPGRSVSGGASTPGSIEVTVYADKPGEGHNIGLTDFTIPGLKGDPRFSKMYARSNTAMTGGFSGTRPKVLPEDVSTAKAAMQSDLSASLKADAQGQIPEGYLLYPDGEFISFETLPASVTEGSSSAELKERGVLHGILVSKNALAQFVISQTHTTSFEGTPAALLSPEGLSFTIVDKGSAKPESDATFRFSLSGPAQIVWGFDEAQFKTDLAGKEKAALQTVLSGYPGIDSATVSLRPFWSGSFPDDAEKITVETRSVE